MYTRNNKTKIIAAFVIIIIMSICGIYSKSNNIIVQVKDINGILIEEKEIFLKQDESNFDLIKNNFDNVTYEDYMIMSIESIETKNTSKTFIAIYINDELSSKGLNDIEFKNGDVICFVETNLE